MRLRLGIFGIFAVIGLAAPAYADPGEGGGNDAAFIAALNQAGISYPTPGQAIGTAQSVCGCLNNGISGLALVHELKTRNPGFSMDDASDFAMIAARFYCPQQLAAS
ncbi:DUF732 domain-containing protein [Mycobacterium shimoidei]|uniref:DUF732 domain-containing protein n=1 Tax=Mycobacterium shimoidei TaxID=29313 RepID=UPI000848CABF|nr:DUF732 domain-containing protein [Mycobacterium shimoidei]MCV7259017.1 DUF732 domain-containing protein [Mycobacterium shimoidei]ODR10787.1 glycine cleavage system P protein [Mycobacterium shimoidei]ORW83239.1 glycine cleavage system P protein [Mycobacterium shimoidei]